MYAGSHKAHTYNTHATYLARIFEKLVFFTHSYLDITEILTVFTS